jgi:hypothetical protein
MDTVISGRFRAERRMGEMQAESPKATGGKPYQATGSKSDPVTPTLAELGIDKHLADRARKYAAMTGLYSSRDCLWPSSLSRSDRGGDTKVHKLSGSRERSENGLFCRNRGHRRIFPIELSFLGNE